MPLNKWRPMDAPESAAEWRHPREQVAGEVHEPDPMPRAEAPYVVHVCDFCSGDGARWVYPVGQEVANTRGVADETGREVRRQFAKHWDRVTPELGAVTNVGATVFSDRWTACDPCSTLIEGRDLERLITRVRRLDEERRGKPQGPRSAYREHFAKFWSLVREREPLDEVQP
jgi:hypothetical protein